MWPAALVIVLACDPDPTSGDKAPPDTGTPEPTVPTVPTLPTTTETPSACVPALEVTPEGAAVDALDLLQLTATGGTGDYEWSLAAGGVGEISQFGTYLAPQGPVTDTVVLRDRGCEGEAQATITVGDPFSVLPATATVLPGTAFTFEAVGGTGALRCALRTDGTGADLRGCDYEAGTVPGVDVVVATDEGTGERVEASITVDPDATWRVWGEQGVALPVDHPFVPRSAGGSGVLDLTVLDGPFTVVGGALVADRDGVGSVHVRDRFAGFEATVPVTGLAPYVPPSTWFGTQSLQGRALALGDVDGDGFADAALGFPEVNGGASGSGAAVVWRGGPSGLRETPAWTWSGGSIDQGAGRALAHADLDGDGIRDLIVGSDADDYGIANVGTLQLFRGLAGGTFETEPWRLLRGVYSSDRFGSSVVVCDVDGDGVDDVAAGAWAHENRSGVVYPNDTGAVMVFRGTRVGAAVEYPDAPTTIRYGTAWTGDAWTGIASSQLGFLGLAGGDVDGDGDCDLAVAAPNDGVFGAPESYGFVQLFEGRPSAEGTLSETPTRQFANTTDTNANFGRDLAMGDVDQDGLADLLVGAWAWDGPRGGSSGGAFLFLGASWGGRAPESPAGPGDADWWVTGRQGSDYLANDVSLVDVDGDAAPDVVLGAPRGETATGVANAGAVLVYAAADIATGTPHDAIDDPTLVEVGGLVAEEFFGQAVDALGDVDGDGEVDFLVLAGRSDVDGYDVGIAYATSASVAPRRLELPGEPAGHDHGRASILVDVDGDGDRDLLVGSPQDVDPARGTFTGRLDTFAGSGDLSFDATSTPYAAAWSDLGGSDRLGFAFAALDFDGDGLEDVAVAARNDSRPTTFGTSYVNPTACPGSVGGAGSVQIWRGTPSGLATTPSFVFYGPDGSANIRLLAGPFDHDGDGVDDLLVAGRDWRIEGGFSILHGRPADPAGITVICADDTWFGRLSGDQLGQSIAAMPDVDGDGCDEAAVGAPRDDLGLTDQGVLRVFWGYGPSCATPAPRVTSLAIDLASTVVGEAMAAGDVDGDGLTDLGLTSIEWRVSNTRLGGVFLVPGSWLRVQPWQATSVGVLPDPTTLSPLLPPDGQYGAYGPTRTARFGASIAAVRDPASGRDLLAVGMPDGDEGGVAFAGGVVMYRWVPDTGDGRPGLDGVPIRVVGGETARPGGALGDTVSATRFGARGVLLVGAPLSSAGGLQRGAAYVVPVERP